jgi:F0F1-type ATP synthase assembly protein I
MEKQNPKKPPKQPLKGYATYVGIASKMAGIILAGVWIGLKLDESMATRIPVFTLVFTIVAAAMSIYVIIKDVS